MTKKKETHPPVPTPFNYLCCTQYLSAWHAGQTRLGRLRAVNRPFLVQGRVVSPYRTSVQRYRIDMPETTVESVVEEQRKVPETKNCLLIIAYSAFFCVSS